jgi:serine/threonine protein kinase
MVQQVACPSPEELGAYASGTADGNLAEKVNAHLAQCSQCQMTVERFEQNDPLSKLLRGHGSAVHDVAQNPLLKKLQKRVRHSMQARTVSDVTLTGGDTPPSADSNNGAEKSKLPRIAAQDYDLQPPKVSGDLGSLGPYRILRFLEEGGMGIIFEALDPGLNRRIALKVMRRSLAGIPELDDRLLKEAQRVAAVKSDHIVTVHNLGQEGRVVYIAMELLEGKSLEKSLQEHGSPSILEVCRIGKEIALGLAAAHEAGIVHRDIKPGNVWLEGSRGRVKILDFGLARESNNDGASRLEGDMVGTPSYMAPEQTRGERVSDRADIFSLGCVLYRLSTGELPFKGKGPLDIAMAITGSAPTAPTRINPSIPGEVPNLILRLLEKSPDSRPDSRRVAQELGRIEESLAAGGELRDLATLPLSELGQDLEIALENELWHTLVFASKGSFGDMEDLFRFYASSVNQLKKVHQETCEFLEVVCATNLEFRSNGKVNEQARDEILRKQLSSMVSHCFLAPPPADETFQPGITSLPLEHAEAKLTKELKTKTRTFVQNFLQVCERLIDQQIMGMVEWENPTACIYYYFRNVVVQTETTSKVVQGATTTENVDRGVTLTTARSRVREGEHEVFVEAPKHHLFNAESVPLDLASTRIPLPFQPVVKAIPAWLRRHVELVTGTQMRVEKACGPVQTKSWATTEALAPEVTEALAPEVKYQIHRDPAITLGRFVIVGWGADEIGEECRREEEEARVSQAMEERRSAREFMVERAVFFLVLELLGAMLFYASLQYVPSFKWFGLILMAAGVWPVWETLRYGMKGRIIQDKNRYLLLGSTAGLSLALFLFCAVSARVHNSLGFACLSIMFLGAFGVLFRQVQVLRGT